jgi:hypothetical protein
MKETFTIEPQYPLSYYQLCRYICRRRRRADAQIGPNFVPFTMSPILHGAGRRLAFYCMDKTARKRRGAHETGDLSWMTNDIDWVTCWLITHIRLKHGLVTLVYNPDLALPLQVGGTTNL